MLDVRAMITLVMHFSSVAATGSVQTRHFSSIVGIVNVFVLCLQCFEALC